MQKNLIHVTTRRRKRPVPVLLSMFDSRIGPKPYIAYPDNFNKEILNKTAKLMDYFTDHDGCFIQENPEEGIKSINLPLMIPSRWARGKREISQISFFTSEETPPLEKYRKFLREAADMILKGKDMYMGFYKNKPLDYIDLQEDQDPAQVPLLVEAKYKELRDIMHHLNDQVKIRAPTNYPFIVKMEDVNESGNLPIPASAINELKELISSKADSPHVFVVYRKVGDMMRVDLIPSRDRVFHVRIIVKQLTPEIIMATGRAIRLPLLFTSGICQEKAGKCSYEAFFTLMDDYSEVKRRVENELRALDFVESIEINLLSAFPTS
ncbi:MAG: hypothetical protein ACTSUE_11905 [Promethearchaeota archaeon]